MQDSVGFAIRLENRYKGLRAPHKLKFAVSGCTRECAEAQGKDFGRHRHREGLESLPLRQRWHEAAARASAVATDLDEDTLVRYVDRFLMFYVRTADRLQRTARGSTTSRAVSTTCGRSDRGQAWHPADLEADMPRVVDTYRCEWASTLEDPAKLARFAPS